MNLLYGRQFAPDWHILSFHSVSIVTCISFMLCCFNVTGCVIGRTSSLLVVSFQQFETS